MNRLEDLIERTLGDDRRALHASPSVVEEALSRAGRIRRRRAVVSSVAAVMVIAAGVAIAVPLVRDSGTPTRSGPITTQPPAPERTHNSAPALTSPLFTVDASRTTDLHITSTVIDGASVYVVGNRTTVDGSGAIVVQRLDTSTLNVLATQDFGGQGGHLAMSGGHLWLAVGLDPSQDRVAAPPVYVIDPDSLDVVGSVPMDSSTTGIAAASDGVWVATQHKLVRLDANGGTASSITLDAALTDVTSDVAHGVLYTLGQSSTSAQSVTERDLTTGAVLATYDGTGPGDGALSATDHGVWLSAPTGTMGQVLLLTRQRLLESEALGGQEWSNQVAGTVAGGVLWARDVGSLSCANSSGGAVNASDNFATSPVVLGGDASATYLQHGTGFYAVTPSAVCAG